MAWVTSVHPHQPAHPCSLISICTVRFLIYQVIFDQKAKNMDVPADHDLQCLYMEIIKGKPSNQPDQHSGNQDANFLTFQLVCQFVSIQGQDKLELNGVHLALQRFVHTVPPSRMQQVACSNLLYLLKTVLTQYSIHIHTPANTVKPVFGSHLRYGKSQLTSGE
jgi:hypothetical protein